MSTSTLLLTLHAAATFYMLGLVCFVQWVHYPLLAAVGPSRFADYESAHLARTNVVVGPPMLLELATALALLAWPPPNVPLLVPWIGLGLLGAIWLSTLLLQIPRHRELAEGFDARAHRRLVSSNWIRTAAWTLRGVLVMWMLFQASAGPVA